MIDYSLRELESFVAVAEELSFINAAKRLHLAQPPVSRHIQKLEDRLGVRLFDRTNRRVALTVAGRAFYSDVHDPMLRLEGASVAAKLAATGAVARLEIGFVSSLFGPEMADVFRRFRSAHADVQLTLQDRTSAEQVRAVAEGRLDGGFIGVEPRPPLAGVAFVPWRKEAVALFVPREHRLAKKRRIALKSVADEPMIAIAAEVSPAYASRVQELCRDAGFRPRIIQEAARAQAVLAMVAAGSGVAILPSSMYRLTDNAVSAVGLTTGEALFTYVFAHRSGPTARELKQFVDVLAAALPL